MNPCIHDRILALYVELKDIRNIVNEDSRLAINQAPFDNALLCLAPVVADMATEIIFGSGPCEESGDASGGVS